jgi:hypothetical protein
LLKKQLVTIYKSDGFKSILNQSEFTNQLAADKAAVAKPNTEVLKVLD